MKVQLEELHGSEGQFTMQQLAINGDILMQELKIEPGRQLGELLQKSFVFARDNPSLKNTKQELLAYCKQLLKSA
jgi:tRNA nucleotidyltransferase domain 2 putative